MHDINDPQPQPTLVDLETQAVAVRSEMAAIKIEDQPSYDLAVEKRTSAVKWLKDADAFFDPSIADAHALHKKLIGQKKTVCGPVQTTIEVINKELIRYDREQEQKRLARQRELDEQARKEAEEQKLADAIHMEDQGADAETVEAVLSEPVHAMAPVVAAPTYQKSAAVVYRDNWNGECFDLSAVVKAAAKGNKTAMGLLMINQSALTQMARAMKETLADAVPGCRAVNNKVIATGRG